jgi:hypothetical protein
MILLEHKYVVVTSTCELTELWWRGAVCGYTTFYTAAEECEQICKQTEHGRYNTALFRDRFFTAMGDFNVLC